MLRTNQASYFSREVMNVAKPNPSRFTEVKVALDVAVSLLSEKKGEKGERKHLLEMLATAKEDAPYLEEILEVAVDYVDARHPEDCPCKLCSTLWKYEQRLGHLFENNRGGNMLCTFTKTDGSECSRFPEQHPKVIRKP